MIKFGAFWTIAICLALLGCGSAALFPGGSQGEAPRGYERLFSPAPYQFSYASLADGAPVRRGARSERFELRHGDCGGSDCGAPRYRAEIRQLDARNPAALGEEIWYGWSFYNFNMRSFSRNEALRLVFGQWTMGGETPPMIRLIQLGRNEGDWASCDPSVCAGPSKSSGDVVLQLEDMRRALGWDAAQNNGYVCRLFDLAANRGRWVDIVMTTNFSPNPNGYVRVWVNGQLRCDYSGPIASPASVLSGARPHHRRGIFSSFTTRWDETHGADPKPLMIAYYDEFLIGKTRADVDPAARAAAGARSVD